MCGIAGIVSCNKNEVNLDKLRAMTKVIAHRGPDGDGHWISDNGIVGFGHRRLSIIDLNHQADQPMHYLGRYTIVFNGEIYNYVELKEQLSRENYAFRTSSDTEVLMALYDRYKEDCLQLLDGMFSFVVYDKFTNEIFAARDRFGEKPFFYNYEKGNSFIFGSEMKCLWAAGVKKEVDPGMLYNYLSEGLLEHPANPGKTFYKGCERLPNAHFLKINANTLEITLKSYYDINWRDINMSISADAAKERFRELFYTSVSRRLRSDVPVGSSLSGGLDSSLVVTVIDKLKKETRQKQETFSAVFPGFAKDERRYMDFVIDKTNVSPHFITPDSKEFVNDLGKLCWHQEEPFGTASIYVQYCVMRLAKEHNVTVLLDGQGADEILAGYHSYFPSFFKEIKGQAGIYRRERDAYNQMHEATRPGAVQRLKTTIREMLPGVYEQLKDSQNTFLNKDFAVAHRAGKFAASDGISLNNSLYNSTFKKGLHELLRYADRNSMAHSREVRLPFLYHELVDFLFTLPPGMKIREGWTKWIMRYAFGEELPETICWRKDKIGYEPPQKDWMETKIMKDKLASVAEDMVKAGILAPSQAVKKLSSNPMPVNWKILMAGELLNK